MKSPAILFYTSDFLTGTMTMTDEQAGKYIRLLCLQHQKGVLSEKDMLFICKSYDEEVFSKFIKNGKGYYNERMKIEMEKRENYSKSRAENRVKGIENKEVKNKKDMNNISKSYDKHMENENDNENINKNIIKYNSDFLIFWNAYPRKVGKLKALEAWNKSKDRPAISEILTVLDRQKQSDQWLKDNGQFVPYPSTYINQGRWYDESEQAVILDMEFINSIGK